MKDSDASEHAYLLSRGGKNLQQTNKIKGTAMQKLVKLAIPNKEEDTSIKKILEKNLGKIGEYYVLRKPIKVNHQFHTALSTIYHVDEFPQTLKLEVPNKQQKAIWKKCSNERCNTFIPANKQKTKKCKKCNIGFFQNVIPSSGFWKEIYAGNKEEALKLLVKEKIFSNFTANKNRLDFFMIINNTFYVLESKNKEKTGLQPSDLYHTLLYPLILQRLQYKVNSLEIIYNGNITFELIEKLQTGFAKKFNFKLNFTNIQDYLQKNNIHIKEINCKVINKKRIYEFVPGDSDHIIINIYDESGIILIDEEVVG